jgi:hypothetical protein
MLAALDAEVFDAMIHDLGNGDSRLAFPVMYSLVSRGE